MNRKRLFLILIFTYLAFTSSLASAQFLLTIFDGSTGDPVSGVAVSVFEGRTGNEIAAGSSDSSGKITINATPPFQIELVHSDYQVTSNVQNRKPDSNWAIEMESKRQSLLTEAEKNALQAYNTSAGTLVMFPPMLDGLAPPRIKRVNRLFRRSLDRAINTHVQEHGARMVNISWVDNELLTESDESRWKIYGEELAALALISGDGRETAEGGLHMSSSYQLLIGETAKFFADDNFSSPVESFVTSDTVTRLWGDYTLMALAYEQVESAVNGDRIDKEKLRSTKDMLIRFNNDLGQNSTLLKRKVDSLLKEIEGRLE